MLTKISEQIANFNSNTPIIPFSETDFKREFGLVVNLDE